MSFFVGLFLVLIGFCGGVGKTKEERMLFYLSQYIYK